MLRYPYEVDSQQTLLASLRLLVSQVPACEDFIDFANQVDLYMTSLSPGALMNVAQIAQSMAKAFDYMYSSRQQTIYSSQYLLKLAVSARSIAWNAALAARVSTGSMPITITDAARSALGALLAWDPAQGYPLPGDVEQLATALMEGVSFGP